MIRLCTLSVTGASGTHTSAGTFSGRVLRVMIDYSASADSGTDVTVATAGNNHPAVTLYTKSNSNTDAVVNPRAPIHDTSGTALTLEGTEPQVDTIPISDHIKLTVAQNIAGQSVTAYVFVDC